jgi:2-polyprenyl-3-methyl-5-hydroxy-6-metoxy-1,4-benzoquinol methylase
MMMHAMHVEELPSAVVLEETSCPIGCVASDELVLTAGDRLHGLPGRFRVVRCRGCGLMRTNPRPTAETIGFYYPTEYRPHQAQATSEPRKSSSRLRRAIGSLFEFQAMSLPDLRPGKLLEVGCGSGGFLRAMSDRGWRVSGLEPSEKAAENARALGLDVKATTLEGAPDRKESLDLVVAWMVLEHLHEPIRGLRRLHAWSREGAWLVGSVPNAASLDFKLFGDAWYALQTPTHLYHYTPETLPKVLERGGWRLERLLHQRILTNYTASLGYRLEEWVPSRAHALLDRASETLSRFETFQPFALYPLAFALSMLGQTGRMTFWARRIEDAG